MDAILFDLCSIKTSNIFFVFFIFFYLCTIVISGVSEFDKIVCNILILYEDLNVDVTSEGFGRFIYCLKSCSYIRYGCVPVINVGKFC